MFPPDFFSNIPKESMHPLFLTGIEGDVKLMAYLKINEKPSDDSFDYMCELPHEDPEDVYCGPEYFRNSSREEFYRHFYKALLEDNAQQFIASLMNSDVGRCTRAIFSILHPYTCVVPPEIIGR